MNYASDNGGDLSAQTITSGTAVPSNVAAINNSTLSVNAAGCNLGIGTYVFAPGANAKAGQETVLQSFHVAWQAAVAGTITIETSNFPGTLSAFREGGIDVADYDSTAGNWIQENPSTAVVAVSGSGNSATALTVTMGGSAAGGCTIHIGNLGTRRVRLKIVTSVGGIVRVSHHGKLGA